MLLLLFGAGCTVLTQADWLAHTDEDGDGFAATEDCDDNDATAYAGAAYNDSDTDCMRDSDGDGYGDASPPAGISAGSDCDDTDSANSPAGAESCDGIDNNCDGDIDEQLYPDADGDGFGGAASGDCTAEWIANDEDCDDTDFSVYPGAPDLCDSRPNDCGGTGWSQEDELGQVAWQPEPGAPFEDWTAVFSEGGPIALPSAGTLRICRGEVPRAVHLSTGTISELAIEGVPIPQEGDESEEDALPVLTGTQSDGSILNINGTGWHLSISSLRLTAGYSTPTEGGGAGSFSGGAWLSIRDSVIDNNVVQERLNGGGLLLVGIDEVLLDGVAFRENSYEGKEDKGNKDDSVLGGALFVRDVAALTLRGCTFEGNTASEGGAVYAEESALRISDCDFILNEAKYGAGGGGLFLRRGDALVDHSLFEGNEARNGGGGLMLAEGATLELLESRFYQNVANLGGALEIDESSLRCAASEVVFQGNRVRPGSTGAVLHTTEGGEVFAYGCGAKDNVITNTPGQTPDISIHGGTETYRITDGGTFQCTSGLTDGCVGDVQQ